MCDQLKHIGKRMARLDLQIKHLKNVKVQLHRISVKEVHDKEVRDFFVFHYFTSMCTQTFCLYKYVL